MKCFDEIIDAVISRVLQDWAMMIVDAADSPERLFDEQGVVYKTHIDFEGVVKGSYIVFCQSPFVDCLTENLLGFDHDVTEEERKDALVEMLNVLSGNLLTEMYGDDTAFDLVLPRVHETDYSEVKDFIEGSRKTFCYLGDGEPMAVSFWLEGE